MPNKLPADCVLKPCPACQDWQAMASDIIRHVTAWEEVIDKDTRVLAESMLLLICAQLRETINSARTSFLAVPKKPERGAMDAE